MSIRKFNISAAKNNKDHLHKNVYINKQAKKDFG